MKIEEEKRLHDINEMEQLREEIMHYEIKEQDRIDKETELKKQRNMRLLFLEAEKLDKLNKHKKLEEENRIEMQFKKYVSFF